MNPTTSSQYAQSQGFYSTPYTTAPQQNVSPQELSDTENWLSEQAGWSIQEINALKPFTNSRGDYYLSLLIQAINRRNFPIYSRYFSLVPASHFVSLGEKLALSMSQNAEDSTFDPFLFHLIQNQKVWVWDDRLDQVVTMRFEQKNFQFLQTISQIAPYRLSQYQLVRKACLQELMQRGQPPQGTRV